MPEVILAGLERPAIVVQVADALGVSALDGAAAAPAVLAVRPLSALNKPGIPSTLKVGPVPNAEAEAT